MPIVRNVQVSDGVEDAKSTTGGD